jgi:hypothetical protein
MGSTDGWTHDEADPLESPRRNSTVRKAVERTPPTQASLATTSPFRSLRFRLCNRFAIPGDDRCYTCP